jgi:signal transduction histidine kinase/DNA-binding response OmpR family regulator
MKFFKYEISSIILLTGIFFLVILTGVYVNKKITTTIEKVNIQSTPDNRLLLMKSLTNVLTEAENNLYSFNLTKDKTYLEDFYKSIRKSEKKLNRLKNSAWNDPDFKPYVDTMEFLVLEKYKILDSLMLVQNQYRVNEALNIVQEKIDEVSALERSQEPKAKGLSLFRRKKPENTLKINYFKKELEEIRRLESDKEIANNTLELSLIQYDRFIMRKITQMLDRLEKNERVAISRKNEVAKEAAKDAKRITIIFSVFCSLLLLLISYTMLKYIYKNNEYKQILKKAKEESDELAQAKVRFLSNMSHELRTPLNSIIGFTDLLTQPDSKLTEEQRHEKLGIIQKSAQLLLKLLNNILDHTKLQANKIEFEKEDFDLIQTVKEVFQILEESARVKNNQLLLHVPAESLHVKGDAFKIKQILLNLVGNAIKFTDNGTIEIQLKFEANEAGKYLVHMSVTDTGIGIAENRMEHIFNEFEQESMHTSKQYGGTGLGLNITKTLIELQGGVIRVESKKGKGTTFYFTIPFEHGKLTAVPKEPAPVKSDLSILVKDRKILVVDDEPYNRKLLSSLLQPFEVEVYEASDGEEACELARHIPFDLILMDIRMPKMNGVDATKQIKAMKTNVPIVALSAGTIDEDKNTAFMFDAVLPKPFKNDHLLAVINKLLDKNAPVIDLNEVLAEDEGDEGDNYYYDLADLRVMSQGNEEFFDEMIELFIRTSKEGISQMQTYLEEKDFHSMSQIAHRICSPCKHLGAKKMYAQLKLIENYKKNAFTYEEMKFVLDKLKNHCKQLIRNLESEKFEEKSI